jgi:hypothetical protein
MIHIVWIRPILNVDMVLPFYHHFPDVSEWLMISPFADSDVTQLPSAENDILSMP